MGIIVPFAYFFKARTLRVRGHFYIFLRSFYPLFVLFLHSFCLLFALFSNSLSALYAFFVRF
jgi:hypothetical protein